MKSALFAYALRIGFAMLVLAACLLAPELVARWLGLDSGWSLRPNRAACQQRSPSLLLDFIPSCTGELNETPVTINAHGFRSGEIREDDSRRILMLGHSSTFGWKVESDETYPAALQRLLDEFQPAPGYQVINAGNPGHTAYQGKVLLSERGLALDPYIVTAAFGFNGLFRHGDMEERIAVEAANHLLFASDDFLMAHSRLYAWARWKTRPRAAPTRGFAETPEKFARNLRAIASLAREHGSRVLFIGFLREGLGEPRPAAAMRVKLEEVARELSVPLVRYRGPLLDVIHPTADGNRALGKDVFKAIDNLGWLE